MSVVDLVILQEIAREDEEAVDVIVAAVAVVAVTEDVIAVVVEIVSVVIAHAVEVVVAIVTEAVTEIVVAPETDLEIVAVNDLVTQSPKKREYLNQDHRHVVVLDHLVQLVRPLVQPHLARVPQDHTQTIATMVVTTATLVTVI